jgi:hypothetical protein
MIQEPKKTNLILVAVLLLLGILLLATTIRGPFIIDEFNYLVTLVGLRQGVLTVPGTEGLHPSKELFAFDPDSHRRVAASTPVFSAAPPLYAPLAMPFLFLGWYGLVLLNVLSLLLTGFVVFLLARRLTHDPLVPWIALVLVLLGGYAIEYAQGLWPHMLSVLLVTASVYFTSSVWNGGGWKPAILGGLLIGIATGIREQNIMLAACLGLTVLVYSRSRLSSSLWYGVGAAIPLSVGATIHYFRQGLWHPFPKFVAYAGQVGEQVSGRSLFDPLGTFWTRFVDFSSQPEFLDQITLLHYRKVPETGAFLVDNVVKKALLQSSPWIALAFMVLIAVWVLPAWRKKEGLIVLKPLSLLVVSFVLVFSMAGIGRTDGLAYNQRYFLEIIPLAAIAIVVVLDRVGTKGFGFLAGLVGSGLLFAAALMLPTRALYETAVLRVPLVLAVLIVVAFIIARRKNIWVSVLLGLCIGWSAFGHLFSDLPASRNRRLRNGAVWSSLEAQVPAHSAIFTLGRWREAAGALMLSRDVVILDSGADDGRDSGTLARELRAKGRPLFVLGNGFPLTTMNAIAGDDSLALVLREPVPLYRVLTKEKK